MRIFLLILGVFMSSLAYGQKLEHPIKIQSTSTYIVDLESVSEPVTHTKFSKDYQDIIIFNGDKISEISTIYGEKETIFDSAVDSYQQYTLPNEPEKVYYTINIANESDGDVGDIIQLIINNKTKKCQFKDFRKDNRTKDIWLIIVVEGNLISLNPI